MMKQSKGLVTKVIRALKNLMLSHGGPSRLQDRHLQTNGSFRIEASLCLRPDPNCVQLQRKP